MSELTQQQLYEALELVLEANREHSGHDVKLYYNLASAGIAPAWSFCVTCGKALGEEPKIQG